MIKTPATEAPTKTDRPTTQADLGRIARWARNACETILSELPAHSLLKTGSYEAGDYILDDSSGDYASNSIDLLRALQPWIAFEGDFAINETGYTLGGLLDAWDWASNLYYGDPDDEAELQDFLDRTPDAIRSIFNDLFAGT